MRRGLRDLTFAAAAMAILPTAANAAEQKPDSKDPNRIVCEKQGVLGSRLAVKRVCMTAAEWAIKRQTERQLIDRSQVQLPGPKT